MERRASPGGPWGWVVGTGLCRTTPECPVVVVGQTCRGGPGLDPPCVVLPTGHSSIMNVPGESTLRREFLRLQQENKSNSEALKQQQQLQQQQQRDPEAHIKHLLHQRQRRIEEQKEERRRVEEVGSPWGGPGPLALSPPCPGSVIGSLGRPNRGSMRRLPSLSDLWPTLCGWCQPSTQGPPSPHRGWSLPCTEPPTPVCPVGSYLRGQGARAPHTLQSPMLLLPAAVWSHREAPSKDPAFISSGLGID